MAETITKQITILVAGRPYPLKIKASDEPTIRKIVKEVNEQIQQFQLSYPTKDKQDSLAMAMLTYATDLHKIRQSLSTTQDPEIVEKLSTLDALLDEALM
ncbi:MAG: cell division protein ZapA [Saprospiraceae bacterium]|nr:cell division protein ZapA [Saprospiraceae bacterium]